MEHALRLNEMKTIFMFPIIACLFGFSIILYSEAIPWTSEENKALDADVIAVGRITSYQDDGAHRYYEISIIKWIKNPQSNQTITMGSITPKVFDPHFPYAIFQKKDLGLFYLKSVDGKWKSTNYSRQIMASEMNDTIHDMKKLVGNNNPDSSVSLERTCKEGYVNAVKNRTGEIFCVKFQTLQKLRERGWAEPLGKVIFEKPSSNVKLVTRVNTDQYLLEILNLQGNYVSNKEIRFDVHEKGFDIRCFSVYAEIYDSSGNKNWEQPKVMECAPGLIKSNFDNVIPFSGIKIDKAGEYRLVVQSRGYEIARTFSIIDQNLVR